MPSTLFNSSSDPSRPDEERFIITDLGSNFEPLVDEVLNEYGGVTRIELSRTPNEGGSAVPDSQLQLAQVGNRVNWRYDECPGWTKGISTVRPEESVTKTFFDEHGKAFDYTCRVTPRKLKQGETIVQKYRVADFALSQLRCGIQGTARMLPSRIVSHARLPVSQGLIRSRPLMPKWQTTARLMMIMIMSLPPIWTNRPSGSSRAMILRLLVLSVDWKRKGGKRLTMILLAMGKGGEQLNLGVEIKSMVD
jgi:hypothetical protein